MDGWWRCRRAWLQPFEERFERVVQWLMRHEPAARATAEVRAGAHMRSMPAWRGHPKLV